MRLLLDTHVILWWLADSPELDDAVKDMIEVEPEVYLSPASVWEVAIKASLGKLDAPADTARRIAELEFNPLPITAEHGVRAGSLPWHHRDPFDRMLIAQAQTEGLTLVTRDKWVRNYDVSLMVV